MKYRIRHTTAYAYGQTVPNARHLVRMLPCLRRLQQVPTAELRIDPRPDEQQCGTDYFGNKVFWFAIRRPHRSLLIESRSEVVLEPRELTPPDATPSIAAIREAAIASSRSDGRAAGHHIYPSRFVPIEPIIRDYAASSFAENRPILAAAIELMERIHSDFVYDPVATDISTPVLEVLAARRGVCQDFSHLMIAALRSLGLPAAYVSGYLRTEPAPGQPRLIGADAMHAWVAVWCGESLGWRGLDPTNAMQTAMGHVEVAFGRDYADVSPVDGVIHSAGHQSLAVSVDVAPI